MPKTNLNNYLQLHFLVFIWGFTGILGALISIDAIPLVWYRMLLATIFVLIYFLIKKKFADNILAFLVFAILGGTFVGLEYFEIFKIRSPNLS